LLLSPEHSLLRQSHAPRFQTVGRINADGFGAGWYVPAIRPEPARYRTPRPMWTDAVFRSMAGLIVSGSIVAAVRSATPGFPIEESGTQPFTWGRWLFVHNGTVEDFRASAGTQLRRMISDERAAGIEGAADSEVLFALALDQLDGGATATEALASVVEAVTKISGGRLNMLLSDGTRMAASVFGSSLYVLEDEVRFGGPATVVASEPFDDGPGWRPVGEGSMVETGGSGVHIQSR
jgi:glutamine amidotransferase